MSLPDGVRAGAFQRMMLDTREELMAQPEAEDSAPPTSVSVFG